MECDKVDLNHILVLLYASIRKVPYSSKHYNDHMKAKITWQPGNFFKYKEGFGIVLEGGKSLLIEGTGGRSGYSLHRKKIPANALPLSERPNFEVQFALDAVRTALAP